MAELIANKMSHPNPHHDSENVRQHDSPHSKMKSNRKITGHWGHETISRPKTLGERHPNIFKAKSKAIKVMKSK